MALDVAAIQELLQGARVSPTCPTLESLARQASTLSQVFEQIANIFTTEITAIINNGGGGATTPIYIIRARVNQVGGVPASQTTFPFNDVTVLFNFNTQVPIVIASGTAQNVKLRGFQHMEFVNLTSFDGETWVAEKLAQSCISARVNHPGGVRDDGTDETFEFDNATLITGSLPPGQAGTVVNSAPYPPHAYADDELIVLNYIESGENSGKWFVVVDDDDLGDGTGTGGDPIVGGFGIDEEKLEDDQIVGLDTRSGTNFGDVIEEGLDVEQYAGHVSGSFRWFYDYDVRTIRGIVLEAIPPAFGLRWLVESMTNSTIPVELAGPGYAPKAVLLVQQVFDNDTGLWGYQRMTHANPDTGALEPFIVDGLNPGITAIRGATGEPTGDRPLPIIMRGNLYGPNLMDRIPGPGQEYRWAFECIPPELASLPGLTTALVGEATETVPQAPYHSPSSAEFQLGHGECDPDPPEVEP